MSARRLLPCGEHAILVEVAGLAAVSQLAGAVRSAVAAGEGAFADVVDIVPAAATVLVVVRDGAPIAPLRTALANLPEPESEDLPTAESGPVIEIPVRYDGPDLDEVAQLTSLSRDEVVAAHTGRTWRVSFSGFAPGFAYLSGGDPRLAVPRRDEPRTSVPAGSVALAGEYSAVYPRSSPGGWQLIGRTDALLFDVDREPPALLEPGAVVRFVEVNGSAQGDGGPG